MSNFELETTILKDRILALESELQYYHLISCPTCKHYEYTFYQCNVCRQSGCKRCLKECLDCACYHCSQHETSTYQPNIDRYHYERCDICHKVSCQVFKCFFCHKFADKQCINYCVKCDVDCCDNCSSLCPNSFVKCRECHLKECVICYRSSDFLLLNDSLKWQIFTLLLVFRRSPAKLVTPPRFIRDIIFHNLVLMSKQGKTEHDGKTYSMCLIV